MAYTKPTISGYNTSPPSDDGSETEDNKVKWSTIKGKITDPVKVLAEALGTASETAWNDLASTATDDGTKGANLVHIEPVAGETGVTKYRYPHGHAKRYGALLDGTDDATALANALSSYDHIIIDGALSVGSTVDLSGLTNKKIEFQGQGSIKALAGLGANPVITIGGAASEIVFLGRPTIDANSVGTHCVYLTGTASNIDLGYTTYKNTTTGGTQNAAIYLDGVHSNIRMPYSRFRGNASEGITHWKGTATSIDGLFIGEVDYDGTNTGGTKGSCINLAGSLANFQIGKIRAKISDVLSSTVLGLDDALGGIIRDGTIGEITGEGASASDTLTNGVVLSKCKGVSIGTISLKNIANNGIEISEILSGSNKNITIGSVALSNVGIVTGFSGVSLADCNGIIMGIVSVDGATNAPTRGLNLSNATKCVISTVLVNAGGDGGASSAAINLGGTSTDNQISNINIYGFAGDGVLAGADADYNTLSNIDITAITDSGEYPINCLSGSLDNLFDGVKLRANTLPPTDAGANTIRYKTSRAVAFTASDATPSVAGDFFKTADTTTYTDFDDGWDGQSFDLVANHTATVTHGANIKTSTGANKTLTVGVLYSFRNVGGVWYEKATA